MVIIKKKDGTVRLCIDYWRLNAEKEMDAYLIPRVDNILDQVGQAKYITTLDLAKGYWQVPVAEEDRNKTAFHYHQRALPVQDVAIWALWSTRNIPENDG